MTHCPPKVLEQFQDETSLATALETIVTRAHDTWPQVDLAADEFITYVAQRVPPSLERLEALSEIDTNDLYLAFGCAVGQQDALAAFETAYSSDIQRASKRVARTSDEVSELSQLIRIRLLAPQPDAPARITHYAGRGTLRAWVRTAALRTALNYRRSRASDPQVDLAEELYAQPVASHDPELRFVRGRYRAAFREAFAEAVHSLSSEERGLLRQHYLRGVTLKQLATIARVHRVTMARRIAKIRAKVIEQTRARLTARPSLALSPTECDSVLRAALSGAELSLSKLLASTDTARGAAAPSVD